MLSHFFVNNSTKGHNTSTKLSKLKSNGTRQSLVLNLRKTIIERESTRKIPCTKYEQNTCRNIEDNKLVLEKSNCSIPILYSGKHLDDLIPQTISNCTNEVTKETLGHIYQRENALKSNFHKR